MKIPLRGQDQEFDVQQFLADQGLTLKGTAGKYAETSLNLGPTGNTEAVFRVVDKDGNESEFDAFRFMEDNGAEPDREGFHKRQQEETRRLADAHQASADAKVKKELEDAGMGEYFMRTAAPYTYKLFKSGKESGVSGAGRKALAVGADAFSLLPRGVIGAYEGLKGRDLGVSMAGTSDYGAEEVRDEKTGEVREENLGEHWDNIREAFRVDAAGVSKDILKESVRDPLTGAAVVAAASSGGVLSPALAARVGPMLASIAKKYKAAGVVAQKANRAGAIIARAHEKMEKAGAAAKIIAGIASEGVSGGLQGVLMNYATGEDQHAWNTFVIEGVEEGAFGAVMAPLHAGWQYLSKTQQVEALNNIRAEAQAENAAEAGAAPPERKTTPIRRPFDRGVEEGQFTDVPRPALPPGAAADPSVTSPHANEAGAGSAPAGPERPRIRTYQVLPDGSGILLPDGSQVPVTAELPPSLPREEIVKKLENPAYRTSEDKAVEEDARRRKEKVRSDIKLLAKETRRVEEEATAAIKKAITEAEADINAEEAAALEASRKAQDALTKDVDALMDPSKETPFPAWNRLFGQGFPSPEERINAFTDFHVDEGKRLKAIRERISPPAEAGEGKGKKKSAPATAGEGKGSPALLQLEQDLRSKQDAVEALTDKIPPGAAPDETTRAQVLEAEKARDGAGEKLSREKVREAMEELPEGPVPKDEVRKVMLRAQGTKTDIIFDNVFKDLSETARGAGAFPGFLAGDLDRTLEMVENGGWRDVSGQDPGPVLRQAAEIAQALGAEVPPLPMPEAPAGGTIGEDGTPQAQASDSGDGGGAERAAGPAGREDGPSDRSGSGDSAGRPRQPDSGLQGSPQPSLPGEPGDARPIAPDDVGDLSPADAARKADEDGAGREASPDYRPTPAASWQNLDLRKKASIVLTKGQRIEFNRQGKEVVERWMLDPSSITEADREVLRHYTGQGGLGVKADEEASEGILNQHYTNYQTIRFAWELLRASGFPMDRKLFALEPAAGIGNFVGHAPDGVKFYANEVDETSARILQILYPRNIVNRAGPFESYVGPKVDIVMTNVPFLKGRGSYEYLESDPAYKAIGSLHNYFLMKSIDQLRDNGVGIFITSTGTMDAMTGEEWRKAFNLKAEIITAYRLPAGTFTKNTGYEGSVDLIYARKRTKGERATSAEDRLQADWVETFSLEVKSKYGDGAVAKAYRTKYYETHPQNVLGELTYGEARGLTQSVVKLATEGGTLEEALARRFGKALGQAKDSYLPAIGAELDEALSGFGESIGRADPDTPTFGLEVRDGRVYRKDKFGDLRPFRPEKNVVTGKSGEVVEKEWDIPESRFAALTELLEAADRLRLARAKGAEVKSFQEETKTLLDLWVNGPKYARQPMFEVGGKKVALMPGVYVTRRKVQVDQGEFKYRPEVKFGDPALEAHAGMDRRWGLIRSLYDKKLLGYSRLLTDALEVKLPPVIAKGDMKRAEEVVSYLLQKFGVYRDIPAREAFEGTDTEFHEAMMSHPNLNWSGEGFEHDNEYLQGDLREKIEFSEKMGLKRQLAKLRKALPPQKTPRDVPAQPHETWWSGEALSAFGHFAGILGRGHRIARFRQGLSERFHVLQGEKVIEVPYKSEDPLSLFLQVAMNQRVIRVPDPGGAAREDGTPIYVPDYKKTQEVKRKWQADFEAWARGAGQSHAVAAAEAFNRDFASHGQGKIDESNLHISGLSTKLDGREIIPYPSQMSLVRRALLRNGYIAAHGVGHGKTLGAVYTLAELRNRGMAKRAIFVVPGKNRGMWHSNLTQVIPGLEVKIISSEGDARRLDLIDASANDYDAILISYDTFKTVPLAKSEQYIREDIALYRKELERMMLEEDGNDRLRDGQMKRLEEKIAKLTNKLHELHEAMKDPRGVITFEDLQGDVMFLDEAHTVKNSFEQMNEYADRQFLNSSSDSHIGNDMVYKTRFLHERNGRGGFYGLTATPTPNNPLEIYKIIKLVAPWEWTTRGINTVDDFIRDFVEIGPIEAPGLDALAGRQREGVIGWKNLRALRQILSTWLDFRKDNDHVKKPEVLARPTLVDMNDDQLNLMAEVLVLSEMDFKTMMSMGVNPLSLTTRAKQLAVDPGLVEPAILDAKPFFYDRAPKLKAVMDNVAKHFKADPKGNQIIFLDNFRLRDMYPMKDGRGEPIVWPKGFGYLGATASGEILYPSWVQSLTEEHRAKMLLLLDDPGGDFSKWNPALVEDGAPMKLTAAAAEAYTPYFDAETGEVYIRKEGIRENLHDSMRKYAIERIGMDPARVFVVNANENGKPEDKTRLEGLVSDGQVSLIIGNSPSLAEGLNLQNRGRAIHHIDVPWTPKELEQRNGRMWRPRTEVDDAPVAIYNYIGRGSMDAKGYTILDNKAKWQMDLFVGNDDFMDNSINNIENTGFSYKDFAESAKVNPEFVFGYRMAAGFMRDAENLVGQGRERDRLVRALEVQKNLYAEAQRKVEDAKKRIEEGLRRVEEKAREVEEHNRLNPDKPKAAPEPYNAEYQQAIIDRNQQGVEAGPKLIAFAEERLAPFEKIALDEVITRRALALVKEVKENKWRTLGIEFPDANSKAQVPAFKTGDAYAEFLRIAMPDIWARSPLLADMVAAKALKQKPSAESAAEDAEKLRKFVERTAGPSSQAGFANLKVMLHLVGGTVFAGLFGPGGIAVYGAGLGLVYGFRRAYKADAAKTATWSLRARLREMPGFDRLEPLIDRYRLESNKNIARDFYEYEKAIEGLSEEERNLIPGVIEGSQKDAPPAVQKAARAMQLIFKRVAEEARRVGIDLETDLTYYPRFVDFEMIQKMKQDPALFEENVAHLVKTEGWEPAEAALFLQAYFDGTEEMKADRNAKAQEELAAWIRGKFPEISDADFARMYNKIMTRFGGRILGNLKYGRVAPKLLDIMYKQDPVYVMSRYIPGAWRTIAQKQFFGENNARINTFLDVNFPSFRGTESDGRREVKSWFYAELNDGRFGPAAKNPMTGQGMTWETARKITAFQYWTKLGTSPISPVRNMAYAFNMAMPLAGMRSTFEGIAKALGEVVTGTDYKRARIAGAVSDRMILDAYDLGRGGENNAWIYMKNKLRYKWHPFTMTEKFNRVFGFYAGIAQGRRLLDQARHAKSEAARDGAAARLSEVIGAERLRDSMRAGALTQDAEDLFGVGMTEAINGTTRPFDLPKWANTPEGTIIGQFRRLAFRQTVVWRDQVLSPARAGDFGPLLRWGVAAGLTTPVIAALAAGIPVGIAALTGDDPEERDPRDMTPAEQTLHFVNTMNMLGLYGDIAAGLNSGDDFGEAPLYGTLLGPTAGSAAHLAKDVIYDFGIKNEDAGKQANQILRREIPLINVLTKSGVFGEGGMFPEEE